MAIEYSTHICLFVQIWNVISMECYITAVLHFLSSVGRRVGGFEDLASISMAYIE